MHKPLLKAFLLRRSMIHHFANINIQQHHGIIRHLIESGYRRLSYSIRLFQYLARAPVCRDVYLHYRSSPS